MTQSEGQPQWTVTLHRKALRELSRLPKPVVQRCWAKIKEFEGDPFPASARQMKGQKSLYRARVGQYRIIYRVDGSALSVLVVKVAHRKDAYRDF